MKKGKAAPLTSTLMARKGDQLTARTGGTGQSKGVSALQDEIVARLADEITRESGLKFGAVQSASIQSATLHMTGLNGESTRQTQSLSAQAAQAQSKAMPSAPSPAEEPPAAPISRQAPLLHRPPIGIRPPGHKAASLADRQALLSSPAASGMEEDADETPRKGPSAILGSVFEVNFGRGNRPDDTAGDEKDVPDLAALGPAEAPLREDAPTEPSVSEPDEPLALAAGGPEVPDIEIPTVAEPDEDPRADGELGAITEPNPTGAEIDEPRESSVPFLLLFLLAVAVSGAVGLWLTRGDEKKTEEVAAVTAPAAGIDATRPAPSADVNAAAVAPVQVQPLAKAAPRPVAPAKPEAQVTPSPAAPAVPAKPAEAPKVAAVAPAPAKAAAPAPEAAAPDGAAVSAAPRTGYSAQLMSAKRKSIVDAEWARLSAAYPALLADQPHEIVAGEVPDRGTYQRLRVGQFANIRDAQQFCSGLDAENIACMVVKN